MTLTKNQKILSVFLGVFIVFGICLFLETESKKNELIEKMEVAVSTLQTNEVEELFYQWEELTGYSYQNNSDRNAIDQYKSVFIDKLNSKSLDAKEIAAHMEFLTKHKAISIDEIVENSSFLGVDYFTSSSIAYGSKRKATILSPLETSMLSNGSDSAKIQANAFEAALRKVERNIEKESFVRVNGRVLGRLSIKGSYSKGAIVEFEGRRIIISYSEVSHNQMLSIARKLTDTDEEFIAEVNKMQMALLQSPQNNSYLNNLAVKPTGRTVTTNSNEYKEYEYCPKESEEQCKVYIDKHGNLRTYESYESELSKELLSIYSELVSKYH